MDSPKVTVDVENLSCVAFLIADGSDGSEAENIRIYNGNLTSSYTAAYVGGITGWKGNHDVPVKYCFIYNTTITAPYVATVGGIIGESHTSVEECFFSGIISGREIVGGIIGHLGSNRNLINSHSNISAISTTNSSGYKGSIVGVTDPGTNYSQCIGGGAYSSSYGKINGECGPTYSSNQTSVPAVFDANIWGVTSYINGGYVYLKYAYWQDNI